MPLQYNTYHTDMKLAIQNSLLPDEILKQIPKSTRNRFKKEDYSSIFGMKFIDNFQNDIDIIKDFNGNSYAKKIYRAYMRLLNTKIKVLTMLPSVKENILKLKKITINTIHQVKKILTLNRALRFFNMTREKYYSWLHQVNKTCKDSVFFKCKKVWINQLTVHEIDIMKKYFNDTKYRFWSIYSMAMHALKKGVLFNSLATWYKYNKIIGRQSPFIKSRRKKYPIGIRASKPKQKIHCDVTIFKPLDHTKVYLYFVMDNFSRYILSWRASLKLSADICIDNLKEAYNKYLRDTVSQECPVELICDGGSENNNQKMDRFLIDTENSIRKLVAQKDIIFSNSLVEAFNKIVKYKCLFTKEILNFNGVVKHLKEFIPEYNDEKPHPALKGLTPHEALNETVFDREGIKEKMRFAYEKRINYNRNNPCVNHI